MYNDIIFSSQEQSNNETVVYNAVNEKSITYDTTLNETDFCLYLSEEESDWEIDEKATSCCFIESYKSEPPTQINSFTVEHNSESNKQELGKAKISIKCETTFSQNFDGTPSTEGSTLFHTTGTSDNSYQLNLPNVIRLINQNNNHSLCSLKDAEEQSYIYNLVSCVLISYPIREIWCKSTNSWQPMAVVILTDFQESYIKLCLWNKHCNYAFSLYTGHIIYINVLQVKSFHQEFVLSLKPESEIITLGMASEVPRSNLTSDNEKHLNQGKNPNHKKIDQDLRQAITKTFQLNCQWFIKKHAILCFGPIKQVLPASHTSAAFREINDLCFGEVSNLKVSIISIKKTFNKRNASVVCVWDGKNLQTSCNLYLNGSAQDWLSRIKKWNNHTWLLYNIACCMAAETSRIDLQTTIFSSAECIFDDESNTGEPCTSKKSNQIVSSYNELTSIINISSLIKAQLKGVFVNTISLKTTPNQKIIHGSFRAETWLNWLQTLNNFPPDEILFTINCKFNEESSTFRLHILYEDMQIICGKENMKTIQESASVFHPLNDLLVYPQCMTVDIFTRRDINEIIESTTMYLKSTVKM